MKQPHINETEFFDMGRTVIDTPQALAQALTVLRPKGPKLTPSGAHKLFYNIQLSLFATRIQDAQANDADRISKIAEWLKGDFPNFRYGHAGNFFVPDPQDDFKWGRDWDNVNDPSKQDRAQNRREYQALLNSGAFRSPIMLVQVNWSGNGWYDKQPFWTNILGHRGIEGKDPDGHLNMAAHLPKLWNTITENKYDSTFRGVYITDFYKPFPTPDSTLFRRSFAHTTLRAYFKDNNEERQSWEENLRQSQYADTLRFNTLVSGCDYEGADGSDIMSLRIMDVFNMAMSIQLCVEAQMLHIKRPVMVPWGTLPRDAMIKAAKTAARAGRAFNLADYLPFTNASNTFDNKSISKALNDLYMQHNSGFNRRYNSWIDSGECVTTFKNIADAVSEWKHMHLTLD